MTQKTSNNFCEASDKNIQECDNARNQASKIQCNGAFKEMMNEVHNEMDIEMDCVSPEEHEAAAEQNNGTHQEWFYSTAPNPA